MRNIEFSEGLFGESVRYECRPLLSAMAGRLNIVYEFEQGSKPEMFWKIRKDRDVKHKFSFVGCQRKSQYSLIRTSAGMLSVFCSVRI